MHPSHLTLAQRKAVSPRLHFFEATQGEKTLLEFLNAGAGADFSHLWDTVSLLSKRGFSDPPSSSDSSDNVPLDQFLKKLDQDFSAAVLPLYGTKVDQLAVRFARQLSGGLQSVSCMACSGGKPVCDGGDDDPIVANGGMCIQPLKMVFALALDVTTRYYHHYSPLFRRLQPPTVYLSTAHSSFPDRAYMVGGATFYHDPGGGRQRISEIRLTLAVDEMNLETYLAVPYVFFHESVCHAFAFVALKSAKRRESEPEDSFAEGWMDLVCMEILSEFLTGRGPAAPLLAGVRFPQDYLTHAGMLHAQRSRVTTETLRRQSHASVSVAMGVSAARKVRSFFHRLLPVHAEAEHAFFELSFGLNLHRFSGQGLDFFTWKLFGLLDEPGGPVPAAFTEEARVIFLNYLKTKNIIEFYDRIVHANIRLTNE